MDGLFFDWDENKNQLNQQKHDGITFEESATVFEDENALVEFDTEHSDYEERFRILGLSCMNNLLIVVHCIRNENTIRIISARKATKTERKGYEERSRAL